MANNWFLRTTGGSNAWATREAATAGIVYPSSGTLRLAGQTPSVYGSSSATIDGSATFTMYAEADFTAVYELQGYVSRDFQAIWQLVFTAAPTVGTVRIVGQAPTVTVTSLLYAFPTVGTLRVVGQAPTVAVSGDKTVAPSTATLRVTGLAPEIYTTPHIAAPWHATVRFLGQAPTVDIGKKTVAPTAGTVRIRGVGTASADFTATYNVFADYAQADFSAIWQRYESTYADFSATWKLYGKVTAIRVAPQQKHIAPDPPSLPTIRGATSQKRINLLRAA